jgi:large subunit ribosomal protein L12
VKDVEEVYGALLLHSAGRPVTEENIKKVLGAVGIKPDEGKIRALIASLEGVDIDKVLAEAVIPTPAAVPAEEKKEEEEKEEEKVEEAAAGLGALFG